MDPRVFLILGGVAAAAVLQGPLGEANAKRRATDFRYTPDPRVMKVVAGAHRSTMADLLWLRALPDMARQFDDVAAKRRWIRGATEVVTDLEPTFGTVYAFGAAHLALDRSSPDVDAAIALLQKGVRENPDSAGLHVTLAMDYYELKKDKAKAIAELEIAATKPGIDNLSMAMLAALKVDEHDDFVAIAYWARALEQAPNAKARAVCENELWRTKALVATRAARDFKAAAGRWPTSPDDVRDAKYIDPKVFDVVLPGLTFDDHGRARYAEQDELERAVVLWQAEDYVAALRNGIGRDPTEEEFFRNFGALPPPPPGKRWKYADAKLSLVDE
jgi:tetratricopeptide (TPR) repeat protein